MNGHRTKAIRRYLKGITHAQLVADRKAKYGEAPPAPEFKGHREERRSKKGPR